MERQPIILSIDDEAEICFALNALFKIQKWIPYSAQSIETGLALFKAYHPDIVLIDYHMKNMNGVEGVKKIRELDRYTPIIVFTIEESPKVRDAFLEAGATDFANKPIKALDLVSRINVHLQLLERKAMSEINKGISNNTMEIITEYLKKRAEYVTASDVATDTGLAYQTVNRYLQRLATDEKVLQSNTYGKVGRPKQYFKWRE